MYVGTHTYTCIVYCTVCTEELLSKLNKCFKYRKSTVNAATFFFFFGYCYLSGKFHACFFLDPFIRRRFFLLQEEEDTPIFFFACEVAICRTSDFLLLLMSLMSRREKQKQQKNHVLKIAFYRKAYGGTFLFLSVANFFGVRHPTWKKVSFLLLLLLLPLLLLLLQFMVKTRNQFFCLLGGFGGEEGVEQGCLENSERL